MITDPDHSLTFGSLDLLGSQADGNPYWFETTGETTSLGNPVPVIRAVTSFLMDGAIEATEGHDNREMVLRICVKGEDSYGLALGEAALFNEVGKRNTLTWTPPNIVTGAGEPCVFQVVNSSLDFDFDDLNELYLQRIYRVTIKALPFAFSQTLVELSTTPPVGTTPVNTLVDACSSTSGWAVSAPGSFSGGAISTSSGIVHATGGWPANPALRTLQLTRTGLSATMTSTNIVRIKMASHLSGGGDYSTLAFVVTINGVVTTAVARDGDYYWYPCPTSPLTTVVVKAQAKFPTSSGSIFLDIDEIYRSDTSSLSTVAGQRQQSASLEVQGSARTQGSLIVVNTGGTTSLGSTLVYTNKDVSGFQPDLRRRLAVSGGVPVETADTSLVSQKSSPLSTSHAFRIADVPPSGYVLYLRVKHASSGTYTITWAADVVPQSDPNNAYTGTLSQSGTQPVTLVAGVWTIVPVAKLVLPTAPIDAQGYTRITLSGPASLLLDEGWIFDVDNGRLTLGDLGTGTPLDMGPYNELHLDAASLENPAPSATAFNNAGSNGGVGAGGMLTSFQAHEFVPPLMNVFFVTTGSVTSYVDLLYYPAYHTHVVAT